MAKRSTPPLLFGFAAALAAAGLVAGCSSAPTLQVVGATVLTESPEGVVVAVHIDATNPNEDPIPLKIATYRVVAAGTESLEVVRSAQATLPAKAVHRLVLPAVLPRMAAFSPGSEVSISGKAEYVSDAKLSEVRYDMGFGWSTVSFSGAGVLGPPPPMPPAPVPVPVANPD